MIDFAQVLNPEQCAAATAGEGPLLVLAAAGTGKTRTLTHRVAYLVENGVPADRILLLTFTNRAAREMIERAQKLVPGLSGIWSGTFHHVCARLLRQYGSSLGYKPGFSILDEEDQKKLMTQCVKENVSKEDQKDFTKKDILLKIVSDAANRGKTLEQVVSSYQTKTAIDVGPVLTVCRAYTAKKFEMGAMDFDDLLVNGLRLLKENERVRTFLQEHFLHVLVDEYQDTNALQAEFTDILAAKNRNIMAVGDDFQCIYTWRGAQFENIMQFPDRWPGCRILKLERNYRSLAPVLDIANAVMKDVPHRFEKTLRPFRSDAGAVLPQLYRTWDSRVEADAILKIVQHLRTKGYAWNDIAVLYRSHFVSIDIQMTLTRARVPFRITSGVGVFEQVHVKDVLAFLRLALDPKDQLSFSRLVELLPGCGETGAKKCWEKIGCSFDPTNPMDRMNLETALPKRAQSYWTGIAKAYEHAAEHLADGTESALVEEFVRFYYGDYVIKNFDEESAESRLQDLTELAAHIATAENGLKGFLQEVALMTNLDARARANLPEDHMHLTTIHQAKGMEWPVVILPSLTDGVLPNARAMDDGNTDEERRLFYVAVTRAKDRLYLFAPKSRKTADGGMYPVELSVFLREIPSTLYDPHEVYGGYTDNAYGGRRPHRWDDDDSSSASGGWRGRGSSGGGWRGGGSSSGGMIYKTTWRR